MPVLEAFAFGIALWWLFILGLPLYGPWLHDILIGPIPPERQRPSDNLCEDREASSEEGPYR